MWRSACAVVLIPIVAYGQSQSVSVQGEKTGNQKPVITQTAPSYRQFAAYAELRQGTTEKMAISIVAAGAVTSPRKIVPGITPLQLQFDRSAGISTREIRYPKTYNRKFSFRADPIPVALGDLITFKLHADRNASIGTHSITGKLTFQLLTSNGVSEVRQVDVQMPVTVVAHNAKVERNKRFPSEGIGRPWIVVLIILSPVLFALMIPVGIGCGIAALTKHYCAD